MVDNNTNNSPYYIFIGIGCCILFSICGFLTNKYKIKKSQPKTLNYHLFIAIPPNKHKLIQISYLPNTLPNTLLNNYL